MSGLRVRSTTPDDLDIDEVLDLYRSVGWTRYTDDPDMLRAALAGSSRIVVARDRAGSLLGLARVVSDSASIAYLQDVLVHPGSRRRGIGAALVAAVFEPYAGVRQKVLLTDDDAALRAFYNALGWLAVGVDETRVRAFVRLDDAGTRRTLP